MAGDEGGVVLGALEAVQPGSPEGRLGRAGSRHMQPLLHLDPGGRAQVQSVKVGDQLVDRIRGGTQGAKDASLWSGLPRLKSACPPPHPQT